MSCNAEMQGMRELSYIYIQVSFSVFKSIINPMKMKHMFHDFAFETVTKSTVARSLETTKNMTKNNTKRE